MSRTLFFANLAFLTTITTATTLHNALDTPLTPHLNPVSHNMKPANLPGLNLNKAAEALTPKQCPGTTIIHRILTQCTSEMHYLYIVPHAAIYHDGNRCGTGSKKDYLIVVAGEKINDAKTATVNGLGPLYGVLSSNARAKNAFKVLQGLDPVYVGFEYNAPRVCGGEVVFNRNTIFIFIQTAPSAKDLNFGFAYLSVGELGMVSVKEDEQICLYKQTRELGPGQKPFSSPTPSPSPGMNYTMSSFDFDQPQDMAPCFPVREIDPIRRVSPSPTPQPSGTQPPTTTPSPTPSQTPNKPSSSPSASKTAPLSSESAAPPSPSPSTQKSPSVTASATASTTPSPTRTTSGGATNNGGVCFPSVSTVQLQSGSIIPISALQIGDEVLVGAGKYSEVFMFTHHTVDVLSVFVRLTVRSNATLALSPSHYIPVLGKLRAARALKIGDVVSLGNGMQDVIVSLEQVALRGLHNPQTLDGQIVVNGIVASTYTQAVNPAVAASLLAPVKWFYSTRILNVRAVPNLSQGSSFFARLLPSGAAIW